MICIEARPTDDLLAEASGVVVWWYIVRRKSGRGIASSGLDRSHQTTPGRSDTFVPFSPCCPISIARSSILGIVFR